MAPEVTFEIEDGALGTLPPNVAGASLKIGVCSKGIPNTVAGYSDITALKRDLGQGPLVEAIAQVLNVAGGPVYACPVSPSVVGTAGATTHEGTGTGTVAGSLGPDRVVVAKVMTGGVLGTATVSFAVDGGAFSTPVLSSASAPWDYAVPGTLITLRFPAGTYIALETYTAALTGAVTQSGAGPVVTRTSTSPVDAYDVVVTIVTAGGLGTGAFTHSVDGGNNVSAPIAIPGGGVYAIPGTGVILTFVGTFVADDTYSFGTTAAGFTTGNVTAALDAAGALPTEWDHVHVVGAPSSAANAYTLAVAVDVKMAGFATGFRYTYAVIECPTTEADSALITAFAPLGSTRIVVCAGDAAVISALTGRTNRRNCAWVATARIALVEENESPARVRRGALKGVTSLYRDEAATPGLDDQRFLTLKTHRGKNGYFITDFRTMAPGGSDYTFGMNLRVMNTACRIARAAELEYLNEDVVIDEDGLIDEKEAQRFEADVNSQLLAGVVGPGKASGSRVVMSRTANILAGEAAPVTVRIRPKGYLRDIETSIGFENPAIG